MSFFVIRKETYELEVTHKITIDSIVFSLATKRTIMQKLTPKKKVAFYIRVSTHDQAEMFGEDL